MIYKGPAMRSSRTQAIKMGTNPKGFEGGVGYDAQGGHPIMPGLPAQHYRDNVCDSMPAVSGAPVVSAGVSFSLKSGK